MSLKPPVSPVAVSRRGALRRLSGLAAGAALGVLAAGTSAPARADVIGVKSAELRPDEDDYVLNAEFDLTLNPTLEEVERFLSRVTSRAVARRDQLQKGVRYDAALRLRLDVNQLPKPFQVDALASREWSLQSDWSRWGFTA